MALKNKKAVYADVKIELLDIEKLSHSNLAQFPDEGVMHIILDKLILIFHLIKGVYLLIKVETVGTKEPHE